MQFKNAAAVCLISLFSATLVVLIARTLDNQAAARLEPQLEQIVEELRAIRTGGPIATTGDGSAASTPLDDGVIVYYFHRTDRCPTCQAIETQASEVVQSNYAAELDSGRMAWKVLNYEKPGGRQLALEFGVDKPVVVLTRMKDGQVVDKRLLNRVWALYDEPSAFAEFVRSEIDQMLAADEQSSDDATETPDIPVPEL